MKKFLNKVSSYCTGKTINVISKQLDQRKYDLITKDQVFFTDGHIMTISITGCEKRIIITKNGIEHCSLKKWSKKYGMMITLPQQTKITTSGNTVNKLMVWRQYGRSHRDDLVPAIDQDIIGEFNYPDINRKIHLPSLIQFTENKDNFKKVTRYSFSQNGMFNRKDKLINKEYGVLTKLPTNILSREYFKNEPKYIVNEYFWYKNNHKHRSEKHPTKNYILPAYILKIPNTFIDQTDEEMEAYFLCNQNVMNSKNLIGYDPRYYDWYCKYNGNYYIHNNKIYLKEISAITDNMKKIRIK